MPGRAAGAAPGAGVGGVCAAGGGGGGGVAGRCGAAAGGGGGGVGFAGAAAGGSGRVGAAGGAGRAGAAAGGGGGVGRAGAAAGGGGGVGCAGAAAGGGGGGVGFAGAAAGGGAGRAGGAAAGGGACGCGAAAGGAGCAGAPGAGRGFGFPSGPVSSFGCACATTSGEVWACDAEVANCITVSAVVASSTRRSFVMVLESPGGKFWAGKKTVSRTIRQDDERPAVRPDCGEPRIIGEVYFDIITGCMRACSLRIQKKRSDIVATDVELRRGGDSPRGESICRRWWTGWSRRSTHR